MVQRLGVEIPYNFISKYELDKNEPPLTVLLAYSRAANIPLEQIVDDNNDLTRFCDALAKEIAVIEERNYGP